jgi:cell division septation protein DedD
MSVVGIAAKDAKSGEKATIIIAGKVKGLTDLKPGKKYFLGTNGSIVDTVTTKALKNIPLGIAFSANVLIIQLSQLQTGDVSGVSTSSAVQSSPTPTSAPTTTTNPTSTSTPTPTSSQTQTPAAPSPTSAPTETPAVTPTAAPTSTPAPITEATPAPSPTPTP